LMIDEYLDIIMSRFFSYLILDKKGQY